MCCCLAGSNVGCSVVAVKPVGKMSCMDVPVSVFDAIAVSAWLICTELALWERKNRLVKQLTIVKCGDSKKKIGNPKGLLGWLVGVEQLGKCISFK